MNTGEIILIAAVSIIILGLIVIEGRLFFLQKKMGFFEEQIIRLYLRKIDKIPALIEVMRNLEAHEKATSELKKLHRKAIAASSERIYDILEMNALISDRFGFLMKLSLVVRPLQKNGNFITLRETIVLLEDSIRRLLFEHTRENKKYNSLVKLKNFTLIGLLFPGSKRIEL